MAFEHLIERAAIDSQIDWLADHHTDQQVDSHID